MSNPFAPDFYRKFSRTLKQLFGCRVYKVSLDAGFTCPNRDGKISYGGCIYCENRSFSVPARNSKQSLKKQLQNGIEFGKRRFKAEKFIAYFQAFTNTYAPLIKLEQLYNVVYSEDDIVGLSVSTRPDCISDEILDLIESYAVTKTVWIEYGLQSMHDHTLRLINRGHKKSDFLWAIHLTEHRKIRICVHVILGLPGETYEDMLATADFLAGLPIHSVKVHLLHVIKGTPLARMYNVGKVKLFSMEEYVPLVVSFIERLPANLTIQRIGADAHPDYLIAPTWILKKQQLLKQVDAFFKENDSYQSKKFSYKNEKSYKD